MRACLASIEKLEGEIEPVFVDNGSTDSTVDLIRSSGLGRLITNTENLGFSVAVNQALRETSAPWVQLLNPDAALDPGYVVRLVEVGESHPGVGSLTGLLVRGEGDTIRPTRVIDSRGIRMTRSGRHFDLDADSVVRPFPPIEEVFGVSGAAALLRREFLEDVAIDGEVFAEDFFAFREDADLAWRGQLKGWRALSVSSARGTHVRGVTPENRRQLSPEINRHSVKNRFLLRIRNVGKTLFLLHLPWTLARDLTVLAATLTVETSSLGAWPWLWTYRRRVLSARRAIQSSRRVSDIEIAHWFR